MSVIINFHTGTAFWSTLPSTDTVVSANSLCNSAELVVPQGGDSSFDGLVC